MKIHWTEITEARGKRASASDACVLLALLCGLFGASPSLAQAGPPADWSSVATRIETDGSLGPAQSITPQGTVYTIVEDLGTRPGSGAEPGRNLFHSFRYFDIGSGDTARFTAKNPTDVAVSRVTGGEPSYINGLLESQIEGADFYFLNPAGVFFGPGASLDVPAAFYTSTADRLGFADGVDFLTGDTAPAVLSMATPDAFGFFGGAPIGRIGVEGSTLSVEAGETFALVGGDIDLDGATLDAPSGTLSLVSVASAGDALFDPGVSWQAMDTSSFTALGAVAIDNGTQLTASGDPAGAILVRAGSIDIAGASRLTSDAHGSAVNAPVAIDLGADTINIGDGSMLRAFNLGSAQGSDVRISATESVTLESNASVGTYTVLDGEGGSIRIEAPRITLRGQAQVYTESSRGSTGSVGDIEFRASDQVLFTGASGVSVAAFGAGAAGSVRIEAPRVRVEGGSIIYAQNRSLDPGVAGSIEIYASDSVVIKDEFSALQTSSWWPVSGGSIVVEAPSVTVSEGGSLSAEVLHDGVAGDITVRATENLRISGMGSEISSSALPGAGTGGSIRLDAPSIQVEDGARVRVATAGSGDAGSIVIGAIALDDLRVEGGSLISAESTSAGAGGDISIHARGSLGLAGSTIAATASGPGDGGSIRIESPKVRLRGGGEISSASTGTGAAGSIEMTSDSVRLSEGSEISVYAEKGPPVPPDLGPGDPSPPGAVDGNISIVARDWLLLEGDSRIEASVGEGLGGSIVIGSSDEPSRAVVLREGSAILAQARGTGTAAERAAALAARGGDISITADAVLVCPDCLINADGPTSNSGGSVVINNPVTAIESQGVPPQISYLDASTQLVAQCDADVGGGRFTVASWPAPPSVADEPLFVLAPSAYIGGEQRESDGEAVDSPTRPESEDQGSAQLEAHAELMSTLEAAEGTGDRRTAARALGQLGALYGDEVGRHREATYLTRRALQLAEAEQAADLLAQFYAQLGALEWRSGHAAPALDAYRRAVSLLEETRPGARGASGLADRVFRQSVEPVYLALVDVLLQASSEATTTTAQQRLLDEARHVVEQWKVAELRNYFRDSCAAELAATARSIESVDPRAAVIYPIGLPDRLEFLVSSASGIARVTVPVSQIELESEVELFRSLLTKRLTYDYEASAKKLHTWLVDPYLALLEQESIETLVFVSSGALRTIPMAALHDGDRFLVERFAVALTPSLDLLAPKPLQPGQTDLLMAGVSEAVQGYPGLPGVAKEVAAIEALYGGEVLLDENFDRAQFAAALRRDRPGIVHLASHAEITDDPDTSFVLTHDGRLPMEELAALVRSGRFSDEPLELLMLSACETAVDNERAALGLAGVSIRAGARSAMGSLWSVSDPAASRLMEGFYRAMKTPGVSKARALQISQQNLLASRRFQHPYYWASYLVMNNWL